ncbi:MULTISPECIES: capsule biosynthesis protein [unclassified Mameliella]|uniref:capsule biosynthesis protein n=1 Tax=unclassified Mameliella TaxID=2630630 RepID=UPI00273E6129|nr:MULTISPECIES: capsule biosynthesis protein [unclassified Mameliella]
MTMKPKAKKFRIRRSPAAAAQPGEGAETDRTAPAETPAPKPPESGGNRPAAGRPQFSNTETSAKARSDEVAASRQVAGETDIDSIRAEGLTARQLRMARRVANKHGFEATSDFDAVRLLRQRGIDPFQRTNMLELVKADPDNRPAAPQPSKPEPKVQLPQTIKMEKAQLPSTETISPAERRATEIRQIQRELAARRRKKMMLLMVRLAAFVLLPTLVAGYYFYAVATPMYSTKSEFLILKAESSGGAMGSLFSGTQFATNQDAIAVQSYLTSKDAMLRLDRDEGFKSHFTQGFIDPIQRLEPEPTNEEAYALYKRHVQIGYDPTEGVIKMEVMAADPQVAADFSSALIGYAEERVDNLSLRKRSNAVKDAEEGLADAEAARRDAQEKLVRMQQEGNVIDPEGRIAALRSQINTYELQLQEKQLQLQALLDNSRPNSAKVEGAQGDIRRLEALLDRLNLEMTTATTGKDSLAEVAVQIKLAEADLSTRDLMLQTALERLEQARRDADSQARYLTTSVVPVPSEDPSYPRKFENTMLAFLIFGGIYLMISLTASILREQVAS